MLFIVDAAGVPCERNEVLRRLHEVANAPVFGYYTSEFGLGSIGGRLFQDTEVGAQAAHTAVRILRGERPERIPVQILEATAPTYDWRELRRWGISEASLPAGSIIQFRQPSFLGAISLAGHRHDLVCLLQAALIVGLWVNRAKRKQGEAEATLLADISSKFVNLPPGEVDREILDAERRICESLNLDLVALWQWSDAGPGVLHAHPHLQRCGGGRRPPAGANSQSSFPGPNSKCGLAASLPCLRWMSCRRRPRADRDACRRMGHQVEFDHPALGGWAARRWAPWASTRCGRSADWPAPLVKRLQLVAQVFSNALARKRADQALRESEERMTLAADAAHFGVWVWNIAHNQVWGSERWQGLFGFGSR